MTLINPNEHGSNQTSNEPSSTIKVRVPKRVLHFSDGVLEEYSDDEDNTPKTQPEQALVDPSTLTWAPWLWYKAWRAGVGTLSVIDSIGEYLAAFFGITTPKYYFELEEYKRREKEVAQQKEEQKGWSEPAVEENVQLKDVATEQPQLSI